MFGRLESFAGPAARSDRDERLIDRPRRALTIDIWIDERRNPLLLIRFQSDVGDRDKRNRDQHNANQIAQRNSTDKKQREQNRTPDHAFAEIRLHQNKQTRRAHDRSAEQQSKHRMHLPELAQKKREHHDARYDRELGRLKINRSEVKPTAGAVDLRADESRQNQKEKSGQIHRQRAPFDPAIVDQTDDHEGEKADGDPIGLFSPEFRRHRILSHVGGTVDGDHAEDGQREHVNDEQPVLAEQFSKEWGHGRSLSFLALNRLKMAQPGGKSSSRRIQGTIIILNHLIMR